MTRFPSTETTLSTREGLSVFFFLLESLGNFLKVLLVHGLEEEIGLLAYGLSSWVPPPLILHSLLGPGDREVYTTGIIPFLVTLPLISSILPLTPSLLLFWTHSHTFLEQFTLATTFLVS